MTPWLDAETWHALWVSTVKVVVSVGLRLILITVGYWLVRKALFKVVDGAMARLQSRRAERSDTAGQSASVVSDERMGRVRTLQTLVKSLTGYALFFVYALTVLQTLDVNITGIVTTAGVAGVAVGFGAQKLVRDVISGFFIVSEDHFAVGDYVTIGAATGVVEELSLRTTRIRDDQGRVWIVPNGDIGFVLNQSRGPVSATLELPVPAVADVGRLSDEINHLGVALKEERPDLFLEPPRLIGLAGFDATGVTIRVALTGQPEKLTAAQLVLRERLRSLLLDAGYLPQPVSAT